jgi:hypothetical protein
MKCYICKEKATCTITVNVVYRPYKDDKPFCETHGLLMEKILGVTRNK